MLNITPSGAILGATVQGIDLAQPLAEADRDAILRALGAHGVLCFPGQALDPAAQAAFAGRFGTLEVNVAAGAFHAPGHPEVMILSNVVADGRPIGLADAGQDWHTDLSYSAVIALANVLHAVEVPRQDGRPLGATRFANMHAAFADLPQDVQHRLAAATAVHDFAKYWDTARDKGSPRAPLSAEQRRRKPPVAHPVFLTHPITGRKVLYADPGYTVRIEGLPAAESDRLLEFLFAHQRKPAYQYEHQWTEGDVLMWDTIGTLHKAVADYGPRQHRLMRRCQVMADRIFAQPLAGTA